MIYINQALSICPTIALRQGSASTPPTTHQGVQRAPSPLSSCELACSNRCCTWQLFSFSSVLQIHHGKLNMQSLTTIYKYNLLYKYLYNQIYKTRWLLARILLPTVHAMLQTDSIRGMPATVAPQGGYLAPCKSQDDSGRQ